MPSCTLLALCVLTLAFGPESRRTLVDSERETRWGETREAAVEHAN